MKRPSFQFYPGDWLHDAALRSVSVGARGLWIDMICIMHQGSDYGYLKVNHKVILSPNLARMCGATLEEVEGWLIELSDAGVYSVDAERCIYSRRMIRDEELRKARAAGGVKGGNPNLIGKKKVNLNPNLDTTPSSSSSSSSSDNKEIKKKTKTKTSLPEEFIPTDSHYDFARQNNLNINDELIGFRLHHEAKLTMSGSWNASFSTWLRNAVTFRKPNNHQSSLKRTGDLLTGRAREDGTITIDVD